MVQQSQALASNNMPQQQKQQGPPRIEADPFAPTPLSEMIQKKQIHRLPPPNPSTSSSAIRQAHHNQGPGIQSAAQRPPPDRAQLEREAKQRKEQFLMFTRVLMKYLEQKDSEMHARAKAVIRECMEKNKKQDPEYLSLTTSMKYHLRTNFCNI